ncbi:MAG: hypothetical protein JO288_08605 [Hyphomicrobiales bacterium]|nr:hypothetical protein [Hyphomicrobiales bacterium]
MTRLVSVPALVIAFALALAAKAADAPSPQQIGAQPPSSCFASLYDFAMASPDECPLAWNGVTLYATIDVGVTHDSHGVRFNGAYPQGVETSFPRTATAR